MTLPTARTLVHYYPDADCAALVAPDGTRHLCLSKESLWQALADLAQGRPLVGFAQAEPGTDWHALAQALRRGEAQIPPPTAPVRRYSRQGKVELDSLGLDL